MIAGNGKIYLYAYKYYQGKKELVSQQLVFNPLNDTFDHEFVGLDHDITENDQAQLAIYGDNALLLFSSMVDTLYISYLITDVVSINFEYTSTIIWPSDHSDKAR